MLLYDNWLSHFFLIVRVCVASLSSCKRISVLWIGVKMSTGLIDHFLWWIQYTIRIAWASSGKYNFLQILVWNVSFLVIGLKLDGPVTCPQCGRTYKHRITLQRHWRLDRCRKKETDTIPRLACPNNCGRTYKNKIILRRHLRKGICFYEVEWKYFHTRFHSRKKLFLIFLKIIVCFVYVRMLVVNKGIKKNNWNHLLRFSRYFFLLSTYYENSFP